MNPKTLNLDPVPEFWLLCKYLYVRIGLTNFRIRDKVRIHNTASVAICLNYFMVYIL